MNIITQEYIEIAVRLRKEYFQSFDIIKGKIGDINNCKIQLEKLKEDLNKIDVNNPNIEKIINEKSVILEKNINNVQDTIMPIYQRLSNLEKEADRLYDAIKEKYPGISNEEIQSQITPFLK